MTPDTVRGLLNEALSPGLIHEDEVIDFMVGRIGAALALLDAAPAFTESSFTDPIGAPVRVTRQVPDGTRPLLVPDPRLDAEPGDAT